MKREFDIKFRPQIESGEYKVETRGGRSARIICWDAVIFSSPSKKPKGIIALVKDEDGAEEVFHYFDNGKPWLDDTLADLFIVTPEPELTEFEKTTKEIICKYAEREMDNETARSVAEMLISSAKRELCKGCNSNLGSYIKGKQDALKEMEENRVYKYEGPYMPTYNPCHHGGQCTNPFHDCINCPRQPTIGINTTTGTSTSKVEGKQ